MPDPIEPDTQESLSVSSSRDPENREPCRHIRHEAVRAAKIDVRVSRNARHVDQRWRQAASSVEILSDLVERPRLAETNVAAVMRQRKREPPYFGAKGVMLPIPSSV